MRFLLQRVSRASVRVEGNLVAAIDSGILVLVGIGHKDSKKDADYLADKLVNLRMFPDGQNRMNRSALDVGAQLLLVSQFTLYGHCRKGRRPSFDDAAAPEAARELYEYVLENVAAKGLITRTGVFQAHMQIELVNDGPVTFLLETDSTGSPPAPARRPGVF